MSRFPFSSQNWAVILRVLGTLLALTLLLFLLFQQGWTEIVAAFRQIAGWRLAAALGLMIISRLAVCFRWYILLRSSGENISLDQTIRITFAGLFASNFLPTTIGGDVVRLAGAIRLKLDAAVSTASLIVDRLIGMAGMAMAVPFALPHLAQVLSLQVPGSQNLRLHPLLLTVPVQEQWWERIWHGSLGLFQRLVNALSLWVRQPKTLLLALGFSWINMLCLFGVLYLSFNGMGEQVSFWLIAGLYSLVYFVTLIPISINGYGLQELSMTYIFSNFAGVSMTSGLTGALLFRTLIMLASLPGAFFVPGMISGEKRPES